MGKITKKGALGLAAWASILAWIEEAWAVTWLYSVWYTTGDGPRITNSNLWNVNETVNFIDSTDFILTKNLSCPHSSWIVNGHFSSPAVTTTETINGHANHSAY